MKEREAQIKEWLAEATEKHKRAAQEHAVAQAKAQEIVDKAAEQARQVVRRAAQEEREAREDLRQLEKMQKLERHEPLGNRPRSESAPNGYVPDEELLTRVYEAAVKVSDASEDGSFNQTRLVERLKLDGVGMTSESVKPHVDYLRRHGIKPEDVEPVFRKGTKLRGGGRRLHLKERDQ